MKKLSWFNIKWDFNNWVCRITNHKYKIKYCEKCHPNSILDVIMSVVGVIALASMTAQLQGIMAISRASNIKRERKRNGKPTRRINKGNKINVRKRIKKR